MKTLRLSGPTSGSDTSVVYDTWLDTDDDAPPLVLIHGLGMGRGVLRGLAAELSARSPVYALDLPGFGDSPETGEELPLEGTAELVDSFIQALSLAPAVVIGHSLGTQVVAHMAANPRIATHLEAAIMVAPTVNVSERSALRQLLRLGQDLIGEDWTVIREGGRQYIKTGPWWALRKLKRIVADTPELIYPKINLDTLVLCGERDVVTSVPWARQVAELLPQGELEIIPGVGHESVIAHPHKAATLIQGWLDARHRDPEDGGTPSSSS